MSATAFQRMRREQAAELKARAQDDQAMPLTQDDVDEMDIDKVKAFLDQSEIKYAHNTGVEKLRERLKDAIN